jgi:hypothetical protein
MRRADRHRRGRLVPAFSHHWQTVLYILFSNLVHNTHTKSKKRPFNGAEAFFSTELPSTTADHRTNERPGVLV